MAELIVVVVLGLICWAFRITFVLLVPADRLPDRVQRGLQFLAPAVLAGIAATELTGMSSGRDPASSWASLGALVVVAAVAWWRRNLTVTVLTGVACILVIDLLIF